jgi:hypothetical protein
VTKSNSLDKECLDLGFEVEFWRLMCLDSPSEAFKFSGQETPSTANVLAAVGVELTAEICVEVDGLST